MSALDQAWNHEDRCERYADLAPDRREVREDALIELVTDDLTAVRSVELDNVEELYMLLSWIDDPHIWYRV